MDRREFARAGFVGAIATRQPQVLNSETSRLPQIEAGDVSTTQTMSGLRSLRYESQQAVLVQGHSAPGDGGGGVFVWASDSAEDDNGGTVIGPNELEDVGRWVRLCSQPVDVRWFGALGDGSVQTEALQKAIDAAPVGGTVLVPDGSYVIRESLRITEPKVLRGSGQFTTGIVFAPQEGHEAAFSVGSIDNVQFHNILIASAVRHAGTDRPNTYVGIDVDGNHDDRPFNHVYRDVYVDGFHTAYRSRYLWSSVFDNFKCGNGNVGLDVRGLSVNNSVTSSSIGVDGESGSKGIHFVGDVPSEGWMINNTVIDNAEVAVQGDRMTHVVISNCILDHCRANAVLIRNVDRNFGGNWSISSNYIAMSGTSDDPADAAVKCTNSAANSANRGNRIYGNDVLAYEIDGCNFGVSMQGDESINNVIMGNCIKNMKLGDIRAIHGNNVIVGNNSLSGMENAITGGDLVANNSGHVYYERGTTYGQVGRMKVSYDEAPPTGGSWSRGDIVWKANPDSGGKVGWVCTSVSDRGEPRWRAFGEID